MNYSFEKVVLPLKLSEKKSFLTDLQSTILHPLSTITKGLATPQNPLSASLSVCSTFFQGNQVLNSISLPSISLFIP